jgi:hypothetical protein
MLNKVLKKPKKSSFNYFAKDTHTKDNREVTITLLAATTGNNVRLPICIGDIRRVDPLYIYNDSKRSDGTTK